MFRSLPALRPLHLLAALGAAAALASPAVAGGACPTDGACHLPRWIPAQSAPFEALGTAVAFDGDHALLGAPGGDAVYAYERLAGGWAQTQRIPAPATSAGGFGAALALHEGRLVVGDPSDTTHGVDAGAGAVYLQLGGVWTLAATLLDPAGAPGDRLGTAVTVTDTWALAGSPGDSDGGRVHLFRESEAWLWSGSFRDFITGTVPEAFGSALSMEDKWLLVGDPLADTHAVDTGAVLLVQITAFILPQDLLVPATLQAGDHFGAAVDFDFVGERAVVGAPGDGELGAGAGAVYLYSFHDPELNGHELHDIQRLTACGGGPGQALGASVDLEGDRLVAGLAGKDPGASPGGRAAVFAREPGVLPETWSLEVELLPGDGAAGDGFGTAVALAGDHVLTASPGADVVGDASGAAYLVSLTPESVVGGACPCDELASVTAYGTGKPGTHGVPGLALDRAPVPGEATTLQLTDALPGALPYLLWGLAPAAVPFDGGTLLVAAPGIQPLPLVDGAGASGAVWNVPNSLALCGTTLFLQVMFVDPGAAGAQQSAQTGGIEATVGF